MALLVDLLSADTVTLDSIGVGTEERSGWVNVGAFTVHVFTNAQGDLTVEAYPLGDTASLLTVFALGKQVATLAAISQA